VTWYEEYLLQMLASNHLEEVDEKKAKGGGLDRNRQVFREENPGPLLADR
jgi:hypothetical protein